MRPKKHRVQIAFDTHIYWVLQQCMLDTYFNYHIFENF